MITTTLIRIFLIASGIGFILVGSGMLFFYIKNTRFRRNCDAGSEVRVYHGEGKCFGNILRRTGDQCQVEYLDPNNKIMTRYFHVRDIYPAW